VIAARNRCLDIDSGDEWEVYNECGNVPTRRNCDCSLPLHFESTRKAALWSTRLELASGVVIMLGAINSYSAALGRENVPIVGGGIFHRAPEGWLHWSAPSVALFGVAAAIYILVRGLDNVGEGLRESNPGWYGKWQRCFRGR
jgi:hypothetical protein